MIAVDLQLLFARLNAPTRSALEAAAGVAISRTHYDCEIEHWLLKLVEATDNDVTAILRRYEIDAGRLLGDITKVLETLKTGNPRPPALSPRLVRLAREAWVLSSLHYGAGKIRSGHLLLALVSDDDMRPRAAEMSPLLERLTPDTLRRDFDVICRDSAEDAGPLIADAASTAVRKTGDDRTPNLDQYTVDLTQRAKDGLIDPVLERDGEIRQIIDVLCRRRQNNPILTGEAGVGKTAVVEGFALRIATGDVPPALRDVRVLSLDLGLLQAGAGVRGEFENRLKGVIEEVKSSVRPIIMFIDEAHTLIGAGGQAGQNDAANLLKPALARGEMRTIAATTWAEHKKYFDKDPALSRRFQVVRVEEPGEATATAMMRALTATLERHHGVPILSEAVVEAVRLSRRYIPARQLPDKAVSLLDTACARVAMSREATPVAIETLRVERERDASEAAMLEREAAVGADHSARFEILQQNRAMRDAAITRLEERWKCELALVREIEEARNALMARYESGDRAVDATTRRLDALKTELRTIQGDRPLVWAEVDGHAVAEVVANWTGIPVGRMVSDEFKTLLTLKERMAERIIGQDHALAAIAQAMWTNRAKLTDPRKPIGVFLMVGTSGVGKTETALALADLIYGGEQNVTTINMTEYKEAHKVSLLLGSPPGYVGFGEGGVLTEAVRRRPYQVILLDELEKAHPSVQDIFFQVFDKGTIKDGEGRDIDFKNTVIIMTSNAGTDLIHRLCADPSAPPDPHALMEAIRPELSSHFKLAFLGRTTIVPYLPLPPDIIKRIVGMQLDRIAKRLMDNHQAVFSYSSGLVDAIAERCRDVESGARNIENILNRTILPELSTRILARMGEGDRVKGVSLWVGESGAFVYSLN